MLVEGFLRRDLELELRSMCKNMKDDYIQLMGVYRDLKGARDRLALLSKNDLQRLDSLVQKADELQIETGKSLGYFDDLFWALEYPAFEPSDGKYFKATKNGTEEVK